MTTGASRKDDFKTKVLKLSGEDAERMIRMGWEDRTTFESIKLQFGFSENEFIRFMRTELDAKTFRRWRVRIGIHGHLKHEQKRGFKQDRFKCSRQMSNGYTKGWK